MAKPKEDNLGDLLDDAAEELANSECPTLAAAVRIAKRHLAAAPPESGVQLSALHLSVADPEVDFDEDPTTGQLMLSLGEVHHAGG